MRSQVRILLPRFFFIHKTFALFAEYVNLKLSYLFVLCPFDKLPRRNKVIYLPRQPRGVLVPDPSLAERGKLLMNTYEELSLIVSVALLIVAILTYTNKK